MYEKNFSSLNAWEVIFGENISEYCCLLSLLVATTATVIVTVHCDNASCFYHISLNFYLNLVRLEAIYHDSQCAWCSVSWGEKQQTHYASYASAKYACRAQTRLTHQPLNTVTRL